MKYLFFAFTFTLSFMVSADDRGNSIMFSDKTDFNDQRTKAPDNTESKGESCMEMSRQIEKLQGKPQRRHAMLERYRAECGAK